MGLLAGEKTHRNESYDRLDGENLDGKINHESGKCQKQVEAVAASNKLAE